MDIENLLDTEFPHRHSIPQAAKDSASFRVHLNHAGVGCWPLRAVKAAQAFAEENSALSSARYDAWEASVRSVRSRLASLIGATPEEIALTKNTSEGLSIVAAGIDWRAGDNIVVGSQEFPSNRMIWESLRERAGVEVRSVDLYGSQSFKECPEDALASHIDDNTRLLAVSSIQFNTGYRLDLQALSTQCQKHGALFCIDAIQSLGAVPFDVRSCGADFICADGHKWLLSPEGTGLLYCRRPLIETMRLSQYGWRMVEDPDNYETNEWRIAADARRFECGSLNNLGLQAMDASLSLFFDIGLDAAYRRVSDNVNYLRERIDTDAFTFVTPDNSDKCGGIITIRPKCNSAKGGSTKVLLKKLLTCNILCVQRAGGIRLSPHFYTTQTQMDYVLEQLRV